MKRKYVKKLFKHKKPYDIEGTNQLFYDAIRENVIHHYNNCDDYKRIIDQAGFEPNTTSNNNCLIMLP